MKKEIIYNYLKKIYFSLIFFIIMSLLLSNKNFYDKYYNFIFKSNIDFTYIKSKCNKILGNSFIKNNNFVSSEKLIYSSMTKYNNGYKLNVGNNYVVNNLYSGIVTYIGDVDEKKSVTITSDNGIKYTYGNIENINVNLYDYINEGIIIGSTVDEYLYLYFYKDEKYLNYEEVI